MSQRVTTGGPTESSISAEAILAAVRKSLGSKPGETLKALLSQEVNFTAVTFDKLVGDHSSDCCYRFVVTMSR